MASLRIADYLTHTMGQPFEWGTSDCAMWATGLCAWLGLRDPMADIRGSYTTEGGAMDQIEREGGLLNCFDRRMSRVDGDGVCLTKVDGMAMAGIVSAGVVLVKTSTAGQMVVRSRPIGVWL